MELDGWFETLSVYTDGADLWALLNNHDVLEDFAWVLKHKPEIEVSITRLFEDFPMENQKTQKSFMKNMEVQLGIWNQRAECERLAGTRK
jgi:hypothetical protein